jgi:phosphoglycolate phosphatase
MCLRGVRFKIDYKILMPTKYLLFDFDGVIVDSFSIAYEVKKITCPDVTEEDIRRAFEGNINDNLYTYNYHNDKCRHDINFSDEYVPRIKNEVKLFPEMDTVIKNLAESHKLIIISSTISAPIREILEKFGLASYFTEIMGNDVHKSKIEKIKMVIAKYGVNSSNCVFITDTLGDLCEASHTGVRAIAVDWGFHSRETLLKGEPFAIVDRPEELESVVARVFGS